MLVRTLNEAHAVASKMGECSWRSGVIMRVRFGGVELFQVTLSDPYHNVCRQCRKAAAGARCRGERSKLPSTGHTCPRCLNPFAGFVRRTVVREGYKYTGSGLTMKVVGGTFKVVSGWASSGRLH